MRIQRTWLWWSVLIALALSSCGALPAARASFNRPPDAALTFQDDFSDSKSGWQVWAQANSVIAYHAGGLRFIVNESDSDFWSRPGRFFEDVRLSATATLLNGPTDNSFGLICRYQDDRNFYLFLASSDGYAGIIKVDAGKYQVISGSTLRYSEAIAQGLASNQMQAECIGSELRFRINDSLVAEASDDDFTGGDIGLAAGTYDTPGLDLLFDDFLAEKP